MMMAPRPPYPMPGLPYQGSGMLMLQSAPAAHPLGVKVHACFGAILGAAVCPVFLALVWMRV
jgi:hypothetical protein